MKKQLAAFAALLLLAACDNGIDPNAGASPPVVPDAPAVVTSDSVTGYVAVGSPVVGASISAICRDGVAYAAIGPTGNAGEFTVSGVPDTAFPCVIKAAGGDMGALLPGAVALHSFVAGGGSVNVNPFTDLALSLSVRVATGQADMPTWLAGVASADWGHVQGSLGAALDALRTALLGSGYPVPASWSAGGFAPFSPVFIPAANPVAGTLDRLLEDLKGGMDAAVPPVRYDALLQAFLNDPSSNSLPAMPSSGSEGGEEDESSLVVAIKALAGSQVFEAEANVIGSDLVDRMGSMRGVIDGIGYPGCESFGITGVDDGTEDMIGRWGVTLTIDGESGGVSLEGLADSSKVVALSPDAADTFVRVPVSTPWHWAAIHPEASFYEIDKQTAYTKPGDTTTYYYHTTVTLGVLDDAVQFVHLSDGASNQCMVTFLPLPADRLAPVKTLAGAYSITRDYLEAAPDWGDLTIGTDGSLTFGGDGPSLAPADIARVELHRVNDYDGSADFRVWALTVQADKDISGDGEVDSYDAINLFLSEDGSLRDLQYVRYQEPENDAVEVSFVPAPVLPAYDDTLAAQLTGNGMVGMVDGEARQVAIADPASAMTQDADGLELFAEWDAPAPDPDVSWRISIGEALAVDTPYRCNDGAANGETLVEFSDSIRRVDDPDDTDDTDPADETSLMPASQSTEIIGDCEMVLTQVTTDPETGKVTGVEGKFRALAWDRSHYRFAPMVAFFRALPTQ